MSVLLLNPPGPAGERFIREGRCTQSGGFWTTVWPPLSLAGIAALCEDRGHDVTLIDCAAEGLDFEELDEELKRLNPSLVVWATGSPTISSDLALAERLKASVPDCKTAVIGTHVSVFDSEVLNRYPAIDAVIRNEPELTASELTRVIGEGRGWDSVLGLTFRATNGIRRNDSRPFLSSLDELPFPAWHLVRTEHYRLPLSGQPFLIVAPLRGCPHRCTFCTAPTYYGKKLRRHSVEYVVREIRHDFLQFGVRDVFIWADTFTLDRDYVREFCTRLVEETIDVQWACNSRVDTVDPELLEIMAKAGCWMMSFGIESGCQDILDRSRKAATIAQARRAVEAARGAGIRTVGHFILGLPGETRETCETTIDFACSLPLDLAQFYAAAPFPGSELYDEAKNNGWLDSDPFREADQDRPTLDLPSIDAATVAAYRREAYRRFYGRPQLAVRLVRDMSVRSGISAIRTLAGYVGLRALLRRATTSA